MHKRIEKEKVRTKKLKVACYEAHPGIPGGGRCAAASPPAQSGRNPATRDGITFNHADCAAKRGADGAARPLQRFKGSTLHRPQKGRRAVSDAPLV